MASTQRDVVLGSVRSLDIDDLAPFYVSLAKSGYQGKVVVFADDLTERTMNALTGGGIEVHRFKSWQLKFPLRDRKVYAYRLIHPLVRLKRSIEFTVVSPERAGDPDRLANYAARMLPVNQSRYPLYLRYLLEHEGQIDRIMLADIRDAVMQRDPFDFDMGDTMIGAFESPKMTIGKCPWNGPWMRSLFGKRVFDEMADNQIVCSGVSLGRYEAMIDYLRLMTDYLATPRHARNRGVGGLDQAVHNYLIWKKILPDPQIYDHGTGPIVHMGWMKAHEIESNEAGEVVHPDGAVVNIVHQYDRHKDLVTRMHDRYGDQSELRMPNSTD